MTTILLVDASSYFYRAYHALPSLVTQKGFPTGAIYGVLNMLARLEKEISFHYNACVFDAKGKTFRHDWYADYKGHRPAMPQAMQQQFEILLEVIEALGWPIVMKEGVEADDVIATLGKRAEKRGWQTIVVSADKDLAQIVSDTIVIVDTMKNETLDTEGVKKRFGVLPAQIPDSLALVGDVSDHIPGAGKVGYKTAAKLLGTYGSLEAILEHAEEIPGQVGANIRAAKAQLILNKKLVTVRDDVEGLGNLEDLQMKPRDRDRLQAVFKALEFNTLLRSFNLEEAKAQLPLHDKHYATIDTAEKLQSWRQHIEKKGIFAIDTETDSLNPIEAKLIGLSFATKAHEAAYVPLHHTDNRFLQISEQELAAIFRPVLENHHIQKIAHHAKYDWHVLENAGLKLEGLAHDTLLQSYVLAAHERHDLDFLARRYLQHQTTTYEEVAGKGKKAIPFREIPIDTATAYAAEDADICLLLHETLFPKIEQDEKLHFVYAQIEMPLIPVLFQMERYGVLIDPEKLDLQSEVLTRKMALLEKKSWDLAGLSFNLNSPKQIQEILFEKMGLPVVKKTPSGQPSTDEEVLERLAKDYELAATILDYRTLAKLKSTYLDKLPKMISKKTGRVHTSFSQAVTVTGRLASSDPNLQNIPIRSEEGRKIREAFIAPPGHAIVSADYSQIELRIMAHLSKDLGLLEAFAKGEDIHAKTASEIFGVPLPAVTALQRRYAKTINFGLIYGMSPYGLAQQLGVGREEAKAYIERYFARYPKVAEYMERSRAIAKEKGYVETIFGRRVYVPEIRAESPARRNAAERQAINGPMQGSAADIIKLAMIQVHAALRDKKSNLVLQVHDELIVEAHNTELAFIQESLPRLMSQVAKLDVPLEVELGVGQNWGEAH
jgi:DNA polymerase-1